MNKSIVHLSDIQYSNYWTLQNQHHVFPIYSIDRTGNATFHFQEPVTGHKFLFEQTVGMIVKRKHAYDSTITGHHNVDIPLNRFSVETFTDDGQHTGMLATHIRKVTDIIKAVQTCNIQHKPSNLSTIPTSLR